ncbi:MAG TPA: methyltransferase domain-containing protein [Rubrobacteraceae bacterium]|nr:methyltransferase domain-containing protein [Rubrobacteraceae bacterium]
MIDGDPAYDRYVGEHYSHPGLPAAIVSALRAAGRDPDALTTEDLAPVDQFHTRGRPATLDLARRAGIASGMRVLDIGGGLGGPARTLATECGCAVEVLDLTEEFCRGGEALTAMTGLSELVAFRRGDALNMPYPDESFDVAWTQHSSMNVPDKRRLYREIQRVLRPGGRLALHEIMAGETSPIHFPVPWAREPRLSHLQPPETVRSIISASGFRELLWIDETASATEWFQQRLPASGDPPPLGLHLLLGPDFGQMFRNQVLNLQEGRISIIQAVFEKQ